MKKIVILLLILLLGLAGCNLKEPVDNEGSNDIENNQEQENEQDEDQDQVNDSIVNIIDRYKKVAPLTMKTDNQNESLENMYQWHMQTPYFEGFEDEATKKLINEILSSAVSAYEKANDYIKTPTEEEERNLSYSFNLTPKLLYNKNGVLSVALDVSQFTGGAHGLYWSDFYSFDVLNSKKLELKDLFREDIDSIELIYDYLLEQVKDDELTTKNLKDFYDAKEELIFFIEDNKINIYFGIYSLGPYAAGEMIFDIPKEAVESKLSPVGEVIYSEN